MSDSMTAIVVGVGAEEGLGAALCKRFARAGLHVFFAGRTFDRLRLVEQHIRADGGAATAVQADTTVEKDVLALFDRATAAGNLDLVIYNAGNNQWGDLAE